MKQLVVRNDDRVFATNNVTSGITDKMKEEEEPSTVCSLLLRNCSTRVKKVNFLYETRGTPAAPLNSTTLLKKKVTGSRRCCRRGTRRMRRISTS
jgi:hypothetical protein